MDGIADSIQGNVASFSNIINDKYVTLVTDPPLLFDGCPMRHRFCLQIPQR